MRAVNLDSEDTNIFVISEIATTFSIAATAYAATNLDNLVLLVSWLLAAQLSARQIFTGYAIGMTLVLVVSMVIGLAGNLIPLNLLGYLGVIPITLGLKMLVELLRRRDRTTDTTSGIALQGTAIGAIALTMLSNSVDSILVFAPLLADSQQHIDIWIAVAFLLMVFLWFKLAMYATTHARQIDALRTVGEWVAPIVMVVVGLYILDNTATDILPGS